MHPRVSAPKIFLRGNRWYVRVQVPRSMQDRLGRREYWVSLRTSDRSVAIQRAATAAQKKRHEVVSAFRLMGDAADVHGGRVDGQSGAGRPGAAAEKTTGTADPKGPDGAVIIASRSGREPPTSTPSRSEYKRGRPRRATTADLGGKFNGLSRRQLIFWNGKSRKKPLAWSGNGTPTKTMQIRMILCWHELTLGCPKDRPLGLT